MALEKTLAEMVMDRIIHCRHMFQWLQLHLRPGFQVIAFRPPTAPGETPLVLPFQENPQGRQYIVLPATIYNLEDEQEKLDRIRTTLKTFHHHLEHWEKKTFGTSGTDLQQRDRSIPSTQVLEGNPNETLARINQELKLMVQVMFAPQSPEAGQIVDSLESINTLLATLHANGNPDLEIIRKLTI